VHYFLFLWTQKYCILLFFLQVWTKSNNSLYSFLYIWPSVNRNLWLFYVHVDRKYVLVLTFFLQCFCHSVFKTGIEGHYIHKAFFLKPQPDMTLFLPLQSLKGCMSKVKFHIYFLSKFRKAFILKPKNNVITCTPQYSTFNKHRTPLYSCYTLIFHKNQYHCTQELSAMQCILVLMSLRIDKSVLLY